MRAVFCRMGPWTAGVCLVAASISCEDPQVLESQPKFGDIVLSFEHRVDGEALQLGVTEGTDGAGNNFRITRLKLTVSRFIAYAHASGSQKHVPACEEPGLICVEPGDNPVLECRAPPGRYDGIRFSLGLEDLPPIPWSATAACDEMKDSEQNFMAILLEGEVDDGGGFAPFTTGMVRVESGPLGPMGCPVVLESVGGSGGMFQIDTNRVDLKVVFDWGKILKANPGSEIDLAGLSTDPREDHQLQKFLRENFVLSWTLSTES